MSKKAQMVYLYQQYLDAHGLTQAPTRDAMEWAMKTGRYVPTPVDIVTRPAREMAEALSDATVPDPRTGKDRRAYLSARTPNAAGDLVHSFSNVDGINYEFTEAAAQEARRRVAGQVCMIQRTLDYIHYRHPEQMQIEFNADFRGDVKDDQFDSGDNEEEAA
jgi:hypothetical protein